MSEALKLHKAKKGKIEVVSKVDINNAYDLSLAYTPGVAEPCLEISKNEELVYEYTSKGNMVAVVSDGTAVLGLGNIGPKAAIPVMEGKAALFKKFANIDAIPLCLDTDNDEDLIKAIVSMAPSFGGINLEDIAAPRCFEIERCVQEQVDIPVFHDDQHGTAIVVCAAVINSLKLVSKDISDVKIVISGAGAAGSAIAKVLKSLGANNIIMSDAKGILHKDREDLNDGKNDLLSFTNISNLTGSLSDALSDADVFIGVSAPNIVKAEDISKMSDKAIVFAMANPVPEILPEKAKKGGVYIMGTGRSDFPNQINNILAFPGVFKGALEARATRITDAMKIAAVHALANYIDEAKLDVENVIPSVFEEGVTEAVALAVKDAWLNAQ